MNLKKFVFINLLNKNINLSRYYGTTTRRCANTAISAELPRSTSKLKMRGWEIHNYGEIDELQFSNKLRVPKIRSSSESLIRVLSTSVNPIDVAMLGGYGAKVLNAMRCNSDKIEFPLRFGREFCGELVQCGLSSGELQLGSRVWGVVPVQATGCHAEYVVVPKYCIAPAPSILSNEEAAAVLYAGLTAWSGLYITGQLGGLYGSLNSTSCGVGTNKRVLVLGGSGSVGNLAIQILKSQGSQVLATCSEDAVEMVRGTGSDHVFNYKNPADIETIKNFGPYDIILDCAGQGPEYAKTLNCKFHQYITFSSPLLKNIDTSGIGLGLIKNLANLVQANANTLRTHGGLVKWGFFAPLPQGIEFLKCLVERQKLLPVLDSCYKFDDLQEAYKKVKNGHLRGKVIINID